MRSSKLQWTSLKSVDKLSNEAEFWCPKKGYWYPYSETPIYAWKCGCKRLSNVVSIITSVKDRHQDFIVCLDSLAKIEVTHKKIAVEHVVHDADINASRKISIQLFSKHHTVYHRAQDKGLYNGFNIGVAISSGNYIAFLNSDDYYEANFISESVKTLTENQAAWVFGDTYWHTKNGSLFYKSKSEYFVKPYLNYSRFHHTTVLARREIFETIGVFPEYLKGKKVSYCADYAWFLNAQKHGYYGLYNGEIIGHMNEGGASSDSQARIAREAMKIAIDQFPNHSISIYIIWIGRMIWNSKLSQKLRAKNKLLTRFSLKLYSIYLWSAS
jgi:GT2 family glycosyltransferase